MHKLSTIRCSRVDNRTFATFDPGYRNLGWAVMRIENREAFIEESGTITLPPEMLNKHVKDPRQKYDRFVTPESLLYLSGRIERILKTKPITDVCYERVFFGKNVSSVVSIIEVCGLLKMLAAVNRAMVFQYTPQQVKQAVTGQKNANKEQVIKMITSLTGYTPETDHEADAIAVGVAHILELRRQI